MRFPFALVVLLGLTGCSVPAEEAAAAAEEAEATSWLGEALIPRPLPPALSAEREQELAEASRAWQRAPDDPETWIWLGRRTAYLGRYREAIEIFTRGAGRFPRDARFLRHRGHRFLTVRDTARAISDLERATALVAGTPDEIEPDGLPNARNIPTSTLHTNIAYHLGLAYYLQGEFGRAAGVYERCLAAATTADMRVAATYWLVLARSRAGDRARASALLADVPRELELLENHAYHQVLLALRGDRDPRELAASSRGAAALDAATVGYGAGAAHLLAGRGAEAERSFREVVATGEWPAFGYLAAEAELARR